MRRALIRSLVSPLIIRDAQGAEGSKQQQAVEGVRQSLAEAGGDMPKHISDSASAGLRVIASPSHRAADCSSTVYISRLVSAVPSELMGEVVATSLDYLTSQSQGQIPTDDKIIAAIKEAMVAMSVA